MTAKDNRTSPVVYAIWALAMVAAIAAAAIKSHPGLWTYIGGGGVWTAGIAYMIVQITGDGDTTPAPYFIQTAGAVVFWIMSAS